MRWKKISEPLNEKAEELSRILAVPKTIASLLLQRGIEDFDSAKHFFRPEWSHLYDPLLMQDMDAAMVKVYCSEMLNKVADDTVQIFGGMGLMEEMPIQRLWRDSRLERIWDGTSEIQRHIITRSILRPLGG